MLEINNPTTTYKNKYTAQQTQDVWPLFEEFLLKEKFQRIFEIGTASGGLTQFISEFSKENNIDTEIMTVDIKPTNKKLIEMGVQSLQIDYTKNISEIEKFIKTDKKLLILCDGGNKVKEFNFFSKYIKVGDFIMAHDYADSYEYLKNHIKNNNWGWCEITANDIKDINNNFKLIEYTNIDFKEEMWVCKTKKEDNKKTLI